jgi:hypothetical protein
MADKEVRLCGRAAAIFSLPWFAKKEEDQMKRVLVFALVLVAGGLCVPALAVDIRIDLGTNAGTTAGNWNNISNVAGLTSDLIDFDSGLGTGVSIDGTGSPWSNFVGDDLGAFPNQDWLIQPATRDGAGLQRDLTGRYTIAGLTGPAYRIEVVSARTSFNYLNTFTVDGSLADRTFLGTAVVTPWNATTDGLAAGNWLIWDNVVPTAGTINLMDVAGPGTLGILNAVRILEVPEPTTGLMMLLVTALGLKVTRR